LDGGKRMSYELKKELIKQKIIDGMEIGEVSKIELVEFALDELAGIDDADYNALIRKYLQRKQEIMNKQEQIAKELVELVEKYYDALVKGL
jgi:hypothetical protein